MSERCKRLRRLLRSESDETLRVWLALGRRAACDPSLPADRRHAGREQEAACQALLASRRAAAEAASARLAAFADRIAHAASAAPPGGEKRQRRASS